MTLDELVESHYDELNENDLYIWQYIFHHKTECQKMSIQQLAHACNVSHTSIIRFTKKIGLDGYSELKVYLKWSLNKQFDFDSYSCLLYTSNGATGVLTLYVIYSLAMAYAKRLETNEKNAAIISLAFFIMIIPQTITTTVMQDGKAVESVINALKLDYLGGQGLFIGMIVALVVTKLYAYLSSKNLTFKLPDSVPPMVSQSLSPVFVVTIIFVLAFVIRVGFSSVSYTHLDVYKRQALQIMIGECLSTF